ncbi:MAG TPA: hypothetical protein DCY03_02545 [Planctomycetaceae bacterium]|nr:hypothetical protein [Planctomycetaceae bacterium]
MFDFLLSCATALVVQTITNNKVLKRERMVILMKSAVELNIEIKRLQFTINCFRIGRGSL